jgi:hypothetical protein
MLASFANLRLATAALAQIRNSDPNSIDLVCKTPMPSTEASSSAVKTASRNRLDRFAATQTQRLRRSNPHSARGTTTRSPSAVSSLGGFRTPATGVCRIACERPASETLHRSRRSESGSICFCLWKKLVRKLSQTF